MKILKLLAFAYLKEDDIPVAFTAMASDFAGGETSLFESFKNNYIVYNNHSSAAVKPDK